MTESATTTLNEALVDIIHQATSGAAAAKNFLVEQAPDVVRQLVTFNLAYHIALIVIALVIAIASVLAARKVYDMIRGSDDNDGAAMPLAVFLAIVASMAWVPMFAIGLRETLELWLAPKVWLIEYAAHLVR